MGGSIRSCMCVCDSLRAVAEGGVSVCVREVVSVVDHKELDVHDPNLVVVVEVLDELRHKL